MYDLLIDHARVVLLDKVIDDGSVACDGGRIASIGNSIDLAQHDAIERIDAGGGFLLPGLVDIHINGVRGFLVNDGPAELTGLLRDLPRYGVTACLPTLLPSSGDFPGLVRRVAGAALPDAGARMLGLFLEGPYLTCSGAARPLAASVSLDEVQRLIDAAAPHRPVFAISPDFPGILEAIRYLRRKSILMFMTHTRADVEQTQAAIEAGVRHATHFYDVFLPPPVSEPGLHPFSSVEAVLADSRVSVAFILDGVHVHPVALQLALSCKSIDQVCLISDANRGAGLPPGRYRSFGYDVEYQSEGAPARIARDSPVMPGALAGSGLTLDRAVRNAMQLPGIDLPAAVRMASHAPACVMGRSHELGRIAEGYLADLALFDKDLSPLRTWVGGRVAFDRDRACI